MSILSKYNINSTMHVLNVLYVCTRLKSDLSMLVFYISISHLGVAKLCIKVFSFTPGLVNGSERRYGKC